VIPARSRRDDGKRREAEKTARWRLTYAPPFKTLFETEAIPLWVWPWLFVGGLVFFLVVEAEKLIIRTARPVPTAPVMAESAA